jgi:predicted kinase
MKTLFLIRGVPGAGKSTLVKSLNVFAVSADDYHTDKDGNYTWTPEKSKAGHQWCQQEVKNAMESCFIDDIAVHNTFTQEWEMKPYFDMAAEYDYRVTTLIVENRHNSKSIHNVPVETIKKMADRFEIKLAPDISYDDFVAKKEHNGLIIHKYKRKVFHDNLWHLHSGLVDARGMVTDTDNNIVQYPFTKIFNYKENGTTIDLSHEVLAIDKINGFMAAVTWHNGEPLVSTTGSLSSDFVAMAKTALPLSKMTKILSLYSNYTFCFEIVHPNDPHIIKEKFGAYLIGGREKVLGSKQMNQKTLDEFAKYWDVMRPEYRTCAFSELLEFQVNYQREGFVVYDQESEQVLKIKTPYYLTAKFIARTKKLEFIFDKNYKEKFDEEYYSLCEYLQQNYTKEEFLNIQEQDRLEIVRNWAENTLK